MSDVGFIGRASKFAATAFFFIALLTASTASAEEVAFTCNYELGSDTEATRKKVGSVTVAIDADAKIARIDFGKGWFRDMTLAVDGTDVKETGPPVSGDELGFFYFDLAAHSGGFSGGTDTHEFFDECVRTKVEKRAEIAPPPPDVPQAAPPTWPASPPTAKAPAKAEAPRSDSDAAKSAPASAEPLPAPTEPPAAAASPPVEVPQEATAPTSESNVAKIAPVIPSAEVAAPPPPVAPAQAQIAPKAAQSMPPPAPAPSPEPATPKAASEALAPLASPPVFSPAPASPPSLAPAPVAAEPAPSPPVPTPAPTTPTSPPASAPAERPPAQAAVEACNEALATEAQNVKVNFANFSTDIALNSRGGLKRIAALAKTCPGVTIEVAGHSDNFGDARINKDLSQRRASAVVQFLIREGVPPSSLNAVGYGQEQPIAPNTTAEGRRLNRRVEFHISPPRTPG